MNGLISKLSFAIFTAHRTINYKNGKKEEEKKTFDSVPGTSQNRFNTNKYNQNSFIFKMLQNKNKQNENRKKVKAFKYALKCGKY